MVYERIKDLRYSRNPNRLKQEEIAKILNISQRAYSGYETGTRSVPIEVLSKLADYYDTSIDYIVDRTDEKKPYPPIT